MGLDDRQQPNTKQYYTFYFIKTKFTRLTSVINVTNKNIIGSCIMNIRHRPTRIYVMLQ